MKQKGWDIIGFTIPYKSSFCKSNIQRHLWIVLTTDTYVLSRSVIWQAKQRNLCFHLLTWRPPDPKALECGLLMTSFPSISLRAHFHLRCLSGSHFNVLSNPEIQPTPVLQRQKLSTFSPFRSYGRIAFLCFSRYGFKISCCFLFRFFSYRCFCCLWWWLVSPCSTSLIIRIRNPDSWAGKNIPVKPNPSSHFLLTSIPWGLSNPSSTL